MDTCPLSAIDIAERSNIFDKNSAYYEYLDILKEKQVVKYTRRKRITGFHIHHIVPKCAGGSNNECCYLTYEEHLKAHLLLCECVKGEELKRKMAFAFKMSVHSKYTSKESFEKHKDEYKEACEKYRCPRGIGFKRSEEEKAKVSKSLIEWHKNEDPDKKALRLKRMGEARKGHIVTEDTIRKSKETKIKNGTYRKASFLGCKHSEKTKLLLSEKGKKQFSDPEARKAVGDRIRELYKTGKIKAPCPCKGKHWYTDGTNNIAAFECPDGYHPGKTVKPETVEKIKRALKERKSRL